MVTSGIPTERTAASAGASAPKGAAAPANEAQLRQTAAEFEAVFLAQMLATMTQNVGQGLAGASAGEDAFGDMLNQEMAKLISRSGGIGVADAVMQEMLKMQEIA
jgi:Rod binding domain-containing protein